MIKLMQSDDTVHYDSLSDFSRTSLAKNNSHSIGICQNREQQPQRWNRTARTEDNSAGTRFHRHRQQHHFWNTLLQRRTTASLLERATIDTDSSFTAGTRYYRQGNSLTWNMLLYKDNSLNIGTRYIRQGEQSRCWNVLAQRLVATQRGTTDFSH